MQDINFKITEQDIRDYLIQHKNDNSIKNKEALFVKYMKENNNITQESLEILMKKYNWDERKIDGTYSIHDGRGYSRQEELSSFSLYLANIHNLDISGICHIMIPTFGYYGERKYGYLSIGTPYLEVESAATEILGIIPNNSSYCLESTIDDYCIAGKIDKSYYLEIITNINIRMGRDICRKELQRYSQIYGEEPVKKIRKIIREWV